MIDYYEMKSQPITSVIVANACLNWSKPVDWRKCKTPSDAGVINYNFKLQAGHSYRKWQQLNFPLWKWVRWEKGLAAKYGDMLLKTKYKKNPNVFYHWKIAHP